MAHGPCLWCNVGEDVDLAGLLHLCDDLLDDIPGLAVTLTAANSSLGLGAVPLGIETAPKPNDTAQAAGRFLDLHKPSVAVIAGSDLPASLMAACKSRRIPLVYLDARRGGPRGLRYWLSNLGTSSLLRMFHSIQAVSEIDAANLASRGADPKRIEVTGPIEPPPANLSCDEDERDYLAGIFGTRPIWLAARMPLAEIDMVEAAFQSAGRISHRLLLIVTPQVAKDGPALAERFEAKGWQTAMRSRDDTPDEQTRVLVADEAGEDGLWYRLASITYLGGSMISGAFPDPYQPGSLGSAIIAGDPATKASGRPALHLSKLAADGACRLVRNASTLAEAVSDLLAPDRAADLAGKAWTQIFAGLETKDRAHVVLKDLLTRADP